MCNVYGAFRTHKETNTSPLEFLDNLETLKMRGRDSFGYVGIYGCDQIVKFVTEKIDSSLFINTLDYFAFESRAIPEPELIEHTKCGLSHDRDTQPFYNGEWVTSHNGTVIQPEKIIKTWELHPHSPVDSAVLPVLFSKCNPIRALKYHLEGSYSLAAYDRNLHELYLCSNFQPLYYAEKNGVIYYASLDFQLTYLGVPVVKVPPYTAIKFNNQGHREESSIYKSEITSNRKVLVICSGGLDSVTTARLYHVLGYEVSLLHFLYSQAAENVEFKMIERIAKEFNYPLIVLNARDIFQQTAKSSRLLKGIPNASALDDAEGTPSYVGNRNMIFGSIAAGIAEENGIGRVVMGLNLSDSSAYPDNALPYLLNMEETLQTSLNQQKRVLFRSPFVNLMKHEILDIALAIGSPLELQVSCYYPTLQENGLPKYCKGCGSQLLRAYAFKHKGWIDPCPYEGGFDWSNCKNLPGDFWVKRSDISLRLSEEDIPYWNIISQNF